MSFFICSTLARGALKKVVSGGAKVGLDIIGA
jgi:hypothetical protein